LIDTCDAAIELSLESGDLLIVNNASCLHARTPVAEPARSERALSRIKVTGVFERQ
jgi:alpha-ketoglutarate-dependent taurine dioxygenase